MDIQEVSIGRVRPNPANSNTHPEEQIAALAKSIQNNGWTMPLLVDEHMMLLAGEGRLKAAQSLGKRKVPVIVARGWTEEQKRAYLIADNKLARNSKWDPGILHRELTELRSLGIDMADIGFSVDDLTRLDEDIFRLRMTEEASGATTDADRPASTPAASDGSSSGGQDGMILLSFMVTPDQRDLILRAVSRAREATGVTIQGAAVHHICKEYLHE